MGWRREEWTSRRCGRSTPSRSTTRRRTRSDRGSRFQVRRSRARMKTFLLLVLVVLLALMVVDRRRIYVRDPLATVYKSGLPQGSGKDGKQSGVQVFVNVSGDVLLWRDAEPGAYRILVQGWNKVPGTPVRLTCLRWMVCLTCLLYTSPSHETV